MEKFIYKSYAVVFTLVMTVAFSCTNLDETIYSQIASEQYHFTDKDAEAMFSPVYSNLRTLCWGWNGILDTDDECGDLWTIPYRINVGWGGLYIQMHQHKFTVTGVDHYESAWTRAYAGINTCNKLLADEGVQSSASVVS